MKKLKDCKKCKNAKNTINARRKKTTEDANFAQKQKN